MLRRFLALLTITAFFCLPITALGQDTPDDPCDPTPNCNDNPFGCPCVPIDGGVSFLIAAGVAYGGKKAFDVYKKR